MKNILALAGMLRLDSQSLAWYEDDEKAPLGTWTPQRRFMAGLVNKCDATIHLDAGESATFLRLLTYPVKRTFDKKYPEYMARKLIPVNYEVPTGAESWLERGYDFYGTAKMIGNYADDLPMVTVAGAEQTYGVKGFGDSYNYSIQDLAASAMAGTNLETKLAFAAKRVIENTVEQIGAFGSTEGNLPGFLNNSNVGLLTAAGGDIGGGWDIATGPQILADLNTIANKIVTNTKGTHIPDTLALPINRYSIVMTTPYSDLVPTPIGRVFLDQSPYIRNIDQWAMLDTANQAGSGPRAVVYKRDAEVVEYMIPQEFRQEPPQPRNLAFIINCSVRLGGVAWHYPLGGYYVDGI